MMIRRRVSDFMGWTFGYSSLQEIAQEKIAAYSNRDGFKLLGHAATNYGRHLWLAIETPKQAQVIVLYRMERRGGDWGYKDMDESMHPFYYDCPLSLLDLVPGDNSDGSLAWRMGVKEYHRRASQTFQPGERVTVYGKPYEVMAQVKRSYQIKSLNTGKVYRCSARKMERVAA
jgi:hypothetical protein